MAPVALRSIIVAPGRGRLDLHRLWEHRDLVVLLMWRDINVRYKQTYLGVSWLVLQPLVTLSIFSLVFGHLLRVSTHGVPYPVFAYCALLPWNSFAASLARASVSINASSDLITKVYFPRIIIPIASALSGLIDAAIGFALLLALLLWYRVPPSATILLVPPLVLAALVVGLAFGLCLCAVNVRYRDVALAIPLFVQMWMYVTPVLYPSTLVPARLRPWLDANPMTVVVEGCRWAVLNDAAPVEGIVRWTALAAIAVTATAFAAGLALLRRTELVLADVI